MRTRLMIAAVNLAADVAASNIVKKKSSCCIIEVMHLLHLPVRVANLLPG